VLSAELIRIREIVDPELRAKVREALARRRDMSVSSIPDWFELDDSDFVDLLDEIRDAQNPMRSDYDPRM
jgi:hypothetical protein